MVLKDKCKLIYLIYYVRCHLSKKKQTATPITVSKKEMFDWEQNATDFDQRLFTEESLTERGTGKTTKCMLGKRVYIDENNPRVFIFLIFSY